MFKKLSLLLLPATLLAGLFLLWGSFSSETISRFNWNPGEKKQYDLSFKYSVASEAAELSFGTLTLELIGSLYLEVLTVENNTVSALAKFSSNPDHASPAAYASPMLVTFAPSGQILQIKVATPTAEAQEQVADVLRYIEMVIPLSAEDLRGNEWTVSEEHGLGIYRAKYNASSSALHKSKQHYEKITGEGFNRTSKARILDSLFIFAPDPSGSWLEFLKGEEKIRLTSTNADLLISSRVELKARPGQIERPLELANIKDAPSFVQFANSYIQEQEQQQSRAALALAPNKERTLSKWNNLLQKFPEVRASRIRWAGDVAELLNASPHAHEIIKDSLLHGAVSAEQELSLIQALQLSGTEQSQQTLAQLIAHNDFHHTGKLRAIVAAGQLTAPAEALLDSLLQVSESDASEEIRETALLNYGAVLKAELRTEPISATERVSQLGTQLAVAIQNRNETQIKLLATTLGNTSHPNTQEMLAPLLNHESPAIRAAAGFAFRNLDDQGSLELLYDSLLTESDQDAREAKVRALTARPPSADTVLISEKLLLEEQNPAIRINLARFLAKQTQQFPSAREVLRLQLQREKNPEVQKSILSGLN